MRLRSASADTGQTPLLKNFIIDIADMMAVIATRRSQVWLDRSRWWGDLAESLESGRSISEIRKEREDEHD